MPTIIRDLDELLAAGRIEDNMLVLPTGEYQIEGITIDLGARHLRGIDLSRCPGTIVRNCTITGLTADDEDRARERGIVIRDCTCEDSSGL